MDFINPFTLYAKIFVLRQTYTPKKVLKSWAQSPTFGLYEIDPRCPLLKIITDLCCQHRGKFLACPYWKDQQRCRSYPQIQIRTEIYIIDTFKYWLWITSIVEKYSQQPKSVLTISHSQTFGCKNLSEIQMFSFGFRTFVFRMISLGQKS